MSHRETTSPALDLRTCEKKFKLNITAIVVQWLPSIYMVPFILWHRLDLAHKMLKLYLNYPTGQHSSFSAFNCWCTFAVKIVENNVLILLVPHENLWTAVLDGSTKRPEHLAGSEERSRTEINHFHVESLVQNDILVLDVSV